MSRSKNTAPGTGPRTPRLTKSQRQALELDAQLATAEEQAEQDRIMHDGLMDFDNTRSCFTIDTLNEDGLRRLCRALWQEVEDCAGRCGQVEDDFKAAAGMHHHEWLASRTSGQAKSGHAVTIMTPTLHSNEAGTFQHYQCSVRIGDELAALICGPTSERCRQRAQQFAGVL